jgi:hypothetical protein
MTKVELQYPLARALGGEDLDAVARIHGVYGIIRVRLEQPAMDKVNVEYDASRMTARDVEAALIRCGVPIERHG